jgi:poly(A) polymerase
LLHLILPGADARPLAPLVSLEKATGTPPDPVRRLAALGGEEVRARLRLSKKEDERLSSIRRAMQLSSIEAGYRLGGEIARDGILVLAALQGSPVQASDIRAAFQASSETFPLKASDLMPRLQGPELGAALKYLEQAWIDSAFQLCRSELLALLEKED